MLVRLRRHLTFSNVTLVLALVFALGLGTAWAIERNSVESKHIVNGQVKPTDTSGLVQGNGKVLANRIFQSVEAPERTLLEIPGFGRLDAYCDNDGGYIKFTNTTMAPSLPTCRSSPQRHSGLCGRARFAGSFTQHGEEHNQSVEEDLFPSSLA